MASERQDMLLFLSLFCGSVIFLVCICEVSPPKKPHSFLANFIVRIPQFIAHLIDVFASSLDAIHLLLQIIWIYPAQTAMSLALLIAFSFQIDWYPVNDIRNAIVRKTREAVLFIFRCVMPRALFGHDEPLRGQQGLVEIQERSANLQNEACLAESKPKSKYEKSPKRPLRQNVNNSDDHMCVVCFTREKSVVLLPCRHLCVCTCCYVNVMARLSRACPVCRAHVNSNMVVYT